MYDIQCIINLVHIGLILKIKIPFNNLKYEYLRYQNEYDNAIKNTLLSANFILGSEVSKFEERFSNYIGTKFCVGVNSGLDALILALRVLGVGEGDEVIVPANTYIATLIAVSEVGARPVLVEPDEFYNIDPELVYKAISRKTKAIIAVHLYGQSARMSEIKSICENNSLYLIEDCAQSHGSKHNNITTGSWGDISCFSFYPTKNLGAFGDGGACLMNDSSLADKVKLLRNYGSRAKYYNEIIGLNTRLDELQAAILNVKLSHYNEILKHRSLIANLYLNNISNPRIKLPKIHKNSTHVWHLFVIQVDDRDKLKQYLESNGVETVIHYPIPPHLSQAYSGYFKQKFPITENYSNSVISLPLFDWMEIDVALAVVNLINDYS